MDRIAAKRAVRLMRSMLLLAGLLLAAHADAAAVPSAPRATVSIVEVDPADGTVLHGNDNVYVHVHYNSDVPIKVWVRPYFRGKEVPAYSNGSFGNPAGEGEAFGWFGCAQACAVDSIHLQVATQDSGYPFMDQATDVSYIWDGAPGAWHTPPGWVKKMQAEEKQRQDQAYKEYAAQPLGTGGVLSLLVFALMLLAVLAAGIVWPLYGLIRWRGKWRWLAAAPLALMVLKTLGIAVDVTRDPTSHNLLPFEYLFLGAVVAPYMLVVWLLRRRTLRREAE